MATPKLLRFARLHWMINVPTHRWRWGRSWLLPEWDWLAAERSFQRALAINPNHAEAYLYYGDWWKRSVNWIVDFN